MGSGVSLAAWVQLPALFINKGESGAEVKEEGGYSQTNWRQLELRKFPLPVRPVPCSVPSGKSLSISGYWFFSFACPMLNFFDFRKGSPTRPTFSFPQACLRNLVVPVRAPWSPCLQLPQLGPVGSVKAQKGSWRALLPSSLGQSQILHHQQLASSFRPNSR